MGLLFSKMRTKKETVPPAPTAKTPLLPPPCKECVLKDEEIKRLKKNVESLEYSLANSNAHSYLLTAELNLQLEKTEHEQLRAEQANARLDELSIESEPAYSATEEGDNVIPIVPDLIHKNNPPKAFI